jgi:hypothetical protein
MDVKMALRSREKFVELAGKRVNKTIKDLRLVGNLSNRSNYKYEEEDVRAIFTTLERELKQARERFQSHLSESAEKPFQLKL